MGKALYLATEHGSIEARRIAADDETHDLTVALGASRTIRAQVMDNDVSGTTHLLALTSPLFVAP